MGSIENSHSYGQFPVSPGSTRSLPRDLPAAWHWFSPSTGVLDSIADCIVAAGAHPGRTVVLLPYAQLLRQAQTMWAAHFPDGFAPRFETSLNWSSSLAPFVPAPIDVRREKAADTLTARALLESWRRSASAQEIDVLADLMVQAVQEVAPLAAACHPNERPQWVQSSRSACEAGWGGPGAQWEAIAMAAALEWAGSSRYPTDVLFSPEVCAGVDLVLVLQGLTAEPFIESLQRVWGPRLQLLPLVQEQPHASKPRPKLHACDDAAQEAQRAVACVLSNVCAGRYPLALVSSDRGLTRRMQAMLDGAGATVRDETGWMLSTTHAGAAVMALVRASVWNPSCDAVLTWLKLAPAFAQASAALEAFLRRHHLRDWRELDGRLAGADRPEGTDERDIASCVRAYGQLRQAFSGRRTIGQWLDGLQKAIQDSGMWERLTADDAGQQIVALAGLGEPDDRTRFEEQFLWGSHKLDAAQFSDWLEGLLEGGRYRPVYPAQEQVVILPMSQMLARPFAAVVMVGCDEVRLPRAPELAGPWTPSQREALRLTSRAQQALATEQAWLHALDHPSCDVFWRISDDAGEPLAASPLVQQVAANQGLVQGLDLRTPRRLDLQSVTPPQARAPDLIPAKLSQSAYADLRQCPYRFFAQRQLGLYANEELEGEVDKRDFGQWLHRVLEYFERAMQGQAGVDLNAQRTLLVEAGEAATRALGLDEAEFLPFSAAWMRMRESYLGWREKHVASGALLADIESGLERPMGRVRLVGRLDRTDSLAGGAKLILDYKTESPDTTRKRVKDPLEDTQMAFYAALHGQDGDQAAYLSFSEREACLLIEQPHLEMARAALEAGLTQDMERIAQGAALQALGEAQSCEFCKVRGLCRKDFWTVP